MTGTMTSRARMNHIAVATSRVSSVDDVLFSTTEENSRFVLLRRAWPFARAAAMIITVTATTGAPSVSRARPMGRNGVSPRNNNLRNGVAPMITPAYIPIMFGCRNSRLHHNLAVSERVCTSLCVFAASSKVP